MVEEEEEENLLQGKFKHLTNIVQRKDKAETAPLQGKFSQTPIQKQKAKPNNTGLPDNLKSGVENLSGYSMDDVKVHYNSFKPAQLQAHAYAQGTDIHLGPGQEKHLPHEAWHVVQQKQGRVKPTMQMKGVKVNDDVGLETEADVMGKKLGHTSTPKWGNSLIPQNAMGLKNQLHKKTSQQTIKPAQLMSTQEGINLQTELAITVGIFNDYLARLGKTMGETSATELRETHAVMSQVTNAAASPMRWSPPSVDEESPFTLWLAGERADVAHMNCWEFVVYIAIQAALLTKQTVLATLLNDEEFYADGIKDVFDEGEAMVELGEDDPWSSHLSFGDALVLERPERHVCLYIGNDECADLGTGAVNNGVRIMNIDDMLGSQEEDIGKQQGHIQWVCSDWLNQEEKPASHRYATGEQQLAFRQLINGEGEFRDALPVGELLERAVNRLGEIAEDPDLQGRIRGVMDLTSSMKKVARLDWIGALA